MSQSSEKVMWDRERKSGTTFEWINNSIVGWSFYKRTKSDIWNSTSDADYGCVEMKSGTCAFSSPSFALVHSSCIFLWLNWFGFCTWLSGCLAAIVAYNSYSVKLTIFPKLQVLKRFMLIVYYDQSQYFSNELITFFGEFETLDKCYAKWPWKLECTWFLFEADVTLRFSNGYFSFVFFCIWVLLLKRLVAI